MAHILKIQKNIAKSDLDKLKSGSNRPLIKNLKRLSELLLPEEDKRSQKNLYMKLYRYQTKGFSKRTKDIDSTIKDICTYLSIDEIDLVFLKLPF